MIGVPVRGTSDAGALLVSFVRTLWEQLTVSSDSEWADSLDEVIWSLVDLAYAPRKMREPDLTRRESRRRAILAYLEQNLSNSELCAQSIAEGVGICERYVQALFADMGTTPSAYIVDRRLDFIAGQIESRGYRAQITNLAYEVGFNSMSSFCRAFRRKFGMTSKEFRIKHQRQA
jgi:AraC-like DNA-binding protein